MAETKSTSTFDKLSPGQKKLSVYAALLLGGAALVLVMTRTTEPAEAEAPVAAQSLTGGADVRAVTIDGLGERLQTLETARARRESDLDSTLSAIRSELGQLREEVTSARERAQANVREMSRLSQGQESLTETTERMRAQAEEGATEAAGRSAQQAEQVPQVDEAARRAAEERARRQREADARRREEERRQALYAPGDAMPDLAAPSGDTPAPQITVYESDREADAAEAAPEVTIQIPAGSIVPSVMVTGLDAPTGTQASSEPMPVLFKIKKEAIMPNDALGDVVDCHLLGAGYGQLASERAYIRGETVSCTLTDNTTVEQPIKFYVAGSDGKNGLPGHLVTRSGRMIAGAAGAATAQGIIGAFNDTGDRVGLDALVGTTGGAIEGASEGFDKLADYYIEMAEETFPVIEVPGGQWVDVVLTQGVELAWKGAPR